ncbi:T-complex 11, partial [Saitoella complicata NRRL Y-17804]|uniref:T-complex 11 n=1 Tax=Saitoella complicata (strain BCRC 22490 / CBS 7301 / JCM 7358 / NBRC 10748 / NRRL Y-17804) TaxID=698492 RepID=UPI0008682DB4
PSTTRLTHVYPPAPLPPITQTTLHELELSEILKNVQLRHDIVHDPNLQFRPNYDGERGMQKRLAADKYWRSLGREIERIIIRASNHGKPSKLPGMFTGMRNILAGLLPAEDRASVSQVLDPALLEQQLRHHCVDFTALADYLGNVMRKHCAPMRDTPIDNMVKHFSQAKTSVQYVQGLQMVFELLEAMKLDVANHQLRLLRGHLLESVVDVERRYWADRVERGRCDVVKVVEWVREGAEKIPKTTKGNLDWITGFVRSFADLLPIGAATAKTAPNGGNAWTLEKFPQTLAFDYERVWKLREDLRDVVSVTLCLLLFRQLVGAQNASKITEEVVASLKHELWVILAVGPSEGRWARTASAVALQIAKRAVEFREGKTEAHPSTSEVTVAENWIKKNVLYESNKPSDIYKMVERRILDSTFVTVAAQIKSAYTTGTKTKDAVTELVCFAERITKIAGFHWGVHGAWYVEWAK